VTKELDEKETAGSKKEKVVGPEYAPGAPKGPHCWRQKICSREEKLKYLRAGERYWFSKEWYGSEKRKNPA